MKIIAIGKSQYSEYNLNWTESNSVPVVLDPSPNNLWISWDADQWDLFFLDSNGGYVINLHLNDYTFLNEDTVRNFEYNKVYDQIKNLLSE